MSFKELRSVLKNIDMMQVEDAGKLLIDAVRGGGKVIAMGNGGSATDADHLMAELVVRYKPSTRPPLPCIALTNAASTTAAANDYGQEEMFARQIEAFERQGDVVVAISTSGSSENINTGIQAVTYAPVIYLTGEKNISNMTRRDVVVNVPSNKTNIIQEVHRAIIHHWCEMLELTYKGEHNE